MLIAIALILLLAWVLGFVVFKVIAAVIHLLLVAAVVVIVVQLIRRGRT